MSDRDLRLQCGEATHQDDMGGLGRMLGPIMDCTTDRVLKVEGPMGAWEHLWPDKRQVWAVPQAILDDPTFFRPLGSDMVGEVEAIDRSIEGADGGGGVSF